MLNSASLNYHQPELEEFVWFEDSPSGQEDKEQILINNFILVLRSVQMSMGQKFLITHSKLRTLGKDIFPNNKRLSCNISKPKSYDT